MREINNIEQLVKLQIDFMGLIFYHQSVRKVGYEMAQDIYQINGVTKVGVFVNESIETIKNTVDQFDLGAVQLHGDESPKYCSQIAGFGVKLFKVFSINDEMPIDNILKYEGLCDYYLFDTQGKNRGGNGIKFDWSIIDEYDLNTPFFLSGGIQLEDANTIKSIQNPNLAGVDINSGFEIEPAIKDIEKVKNFKEALNGK